MRRNTLYKKIGQAIHDHKLRFFQMERNGATYLLPGTPETISEMLGVRTTFTPEILLSRVSRVFNAQCQFITYTQYREKVELAKNPDSKIVVLMNYSKPDLT